MRSFFATFICLVLVSAAAEKAHTPPYLSKSSNRITKGPYVQAPAPDRISILWETANPAWCTSAYADDWTKALAQNHER